MASASALFPRRLKSKLKSKKLRRVRRQEKVMQASIGPSFKKKNQSADTRIYYSLMMPLAWKPKYKIPLIMIGISQSSYTSSKSTKYKQVKAKLCSKSIPPREGYNKDQVHSS
jgi:hypothetical protein